MDFRAHVLEDECVLQDCLGFNSFQTLTLDQSNELKEYAIETLQDYKYSCLGLLIITGKGVGTSGAPVPRSPVVVEALHALAAIVHATLNNSMVKKVKPKSGE